MARTIGNTILTGNMKMSVGKKRGTGMRKNIVILSPTVKRAVYEWKAFLSRWSTIIKKANRASLCIELLSGHKIYFKGETEGQRALLGLHADVICVDEFVMSQEESEE